jgi:hypothetical protein
MIVTSGYITIQEKKTDVHSGSIQAKATLPSGKELRLCSPGESSRYGAILWQTELTHRTGLKIVGCLAIVGGGYCVIPVVIENG